MSEIKQYLGHYSADLQAQVQSMLDAEKTAAWLLNKYPSPHSLSSEKTLYQFVQELKREYMRSAAPINKVLYDDKLHVIHNALGLHTFVSRVQGKKLKAKNEIRVAALFRHVPEPFLRMIVAHELAHLREKEHNKAFYKLCQHMAPDYHQLEFEVRVYLCHRDRFGGLWLP